MGIKGLLGRAGKTQTLTEQCRAAVEQLQGKPSTDVLVEALQRAADDVWTVDEGEDHERAEEVRRITQASSTPLGEPYGPGTTVGDMARRASKPAEAARVLYAVARSARPRRALEMGTCCGVSGAYLAQAIDPGALRSLELSPILAGAAADAWRQVGISNAETVVGDFADTIDAALEWCPDFVFVDGNHREGPTLDYLERVTAVCSSGSLVVWDDIAWSDGMRRAWQRISADPRIEAAVAVGGVGYSILA